VHGVPVVGEVVVARAEAALAVAEAVDCGRGAPGLAQGAGGEGAVGDGAPAHAPERGEVWEVAAGVEVVFEGTRVVGGIGGVLQGVGRAEGGAARGCEVGCVGGEFARPVGVRVLRPDHGAGVVTGSCGRPGEGVERAWDGEAGALVVLPACGCGPGCLVFAAAVVH